MNQYMEVFIDESKEHLQSCSQKLLELKKKPRASDCERYFQSRSYTQRHVSHNGL